MSADPLQYNEQLYESKSTSSACLPLGAHLLPKPGEDEGTQEYVSAPEEASKAITLVLVNEPHLR